MALKAGTGALRALRLTMILMVTALALAAPAMAQESDTDEGEASASSQQYGVDSAESLADGIRDVSDTAGRGADAINGALADSGSPDGETDSKRGKVIGLSVLPETGGAPLIALGIGVLLVGGGLVARRLVR